MMMTPTMIELLSLVKDGLVDGELQQGFTAGDISGYAGVTLTEAEEALVSGLAIQIATVDNGKYTLDISKDVMEEAQKANLLTHIKTCPTGGDDFSYVKLLADAGFLALGGYGDDIKYMLDVINAVKTSECDYAKVAPKLERVETLLQLINQRALTE